jgi:hypothetical protein
MTSTTFSGARAFFEGDVEPTVSAWRASPTDLRLAKHAAISLNHLVDYFFHDFHNVAPHRVFNKKNLIGFRRELCVRFPNFALIRDVAEAHKHVELNRTDRVLTSTNQTTVGNLGYGEAEFGIGTYGGGPEVVVELDSRVRRHVSAAVGDVESMWESLLAEPVPQPATTNCDN